MAGCDPRSDHALMEATRRGDTEAFATLVVRHAPAVSAFLRRMTGDVHRAEDLAQEAFLRVYRCARDYRPAARFTTWLYTIALNLARDAHKSDGRHPAVYLEDVPGGALARKTGEDGDEGPLVAASRSEVREAVRRVVGRLPEPYRSALVLRDLQGLSYEETAEVLGCPIGTAKSRVNRARLCFAEFYAREAAAREGAAAGGARG